MKMNSKDNIKMKGNDNNDLNDMLNNLSIKDPPDIISEKFENLEIIEKQVECSQATKDNSPEDSGYEDDKDGICNIKLETNQDTTVSEVEKSLNEEPVDKSDITKDKESALDNISKKEEEFLGDHEQDVTDVEKLPSKICHQDLIISGDKDDSEKDYDESDTLDSAKKSVKDIEDSGYIRRTGKTLQTPPHMGLDGQDAMYFSMAKNYPLDNPNNYPSDNFNQYDMGGSQAFSPYQLSPESNSMNSYATPQFSQGYPCFDNQNTAMGYDSPQSSPSPYYQNDSTRTNFRNTSHDSDCDANTFSGYPYVLTPPPSVSPSKQLLDGSSPCHQSCIQIVELMDKVDDSSLADRSSGPEIELKNLMNALECEKNIPLWGSLMSGNLNEQSTMDGLPLNKGIQYANENVDPVERLWIDIQETDSSDFGKYLQPNPLTVAERDVLSICDQQTLLDLESRVSAVLSNNPMAIIPDDQHGDTNLIVLASRDANNRDKIVEKIYALATALSGVQVCCNLPVQRYQCDSCGNTNTQSFHTPLTLSNVQGYTALSCAVLRGYPTVIVQYMVALIQMNKSDLNREFCGKRIKLYQKATDYPCLSSYATEFDATPNW